MTSIMRASEFRYFLKCKMPFTRIFNGTIKKELQKCIAVYPRGTVPANTALGGSENSSYGELPLTIVVHWTENTDECENAANKLYSLLESVSDESFRTEDIDSWDEDMDVWNLENCEWDGLGERNIIQIKMIDSCPIDVERDSRNICEKVIRIVVIYEKEVR